MCPRYAPHPHRRRSYRDHNCAPIPHVGAGTDAAVAVVAAAVADGGAVAVVVASGTATDDAADHRWCRAPCGSNTAVGIYGSNVQLWCWYVGGVASRSRVITQTLTWSGAGADGNGLGGCCSCCCGSNTGCSGSGSGSCCSRSLSFSVSFSLYLFHYPALLGV